MNMFIGSPFSSFCGPEHRDPKKVTEGIAALSLHAALDQHSQLKSVIIADKEAIMTRDRDGDR